MPAKRAYPPLADGTKPPSVTQITGRYKDSGGLLWWSFEQGKAAERGEISGLYQKRDEAANAGSIAHDLVEKAVQGVQEKNMKAYIWKEYDCPREIAAQAWQGFNNYLEWQDNSKIKIVVQEMQLVSEKYRTAGTPDAIGKDSKGRYCLLDWKTSNAIYQEYLCQLGGYDLIISDCLPQYYPFEGGYHLLRFSKEEADFHHHYWANLDDAKKLFLLYREAYDLDKKLKKRI